MHPGQECRPHQFLETQGVTSGMQPHLHQDTTSGDHLFLKDQTLIDHSVLKAWTQE